MIRGIRNIADNILRLPELRGFKESDFDAGEAVCIQREIFKRKRILDILYDEYSHPFIESAGRSPGGARIVEIGSGTSPLKEKIPGIICSDVVNCPWLDLSFSAYRIPFKDGSLDRVFLMFAGHHLGRFKDFLDEAYRSLKPGGEMVIVDPAITPFSKFYYRYFHADKMDLEAESWEFRDSGRLSGSNIAMDWIVFFRDRKRFNELYPGFVIEKVEYNTCLSFLLSGGLRVRQLMPTFIIKLIFYLENWIIRHVTNKIAVTMAVTIKRT